MTKFFNFIKRNWQLLIILFLVYLLFKSGILPTLPFFSYKRSVPYYPESIGGGPGVGPQSFVAPPSTNTPPAPEVKERLVVKNTWLSLLVKSVRQVESEIIQKAEKVGGYLVESQIDSSEGVDHGTVIVRVPTIKLDETLSFIRSLGVRVISENLQGYDVTDEYIDIKARLETLNKTKIKFEEILNKAEKVPEILEVQRELINLQSQIDSLKGQEQYLEKSARNAKITVYLATDELALPYTPSKPWRPEAVFKQAVRSLILTLRGLGTLAIWLSVYSVILVPGYFLLRFLINFIKNNKK